MTDARPNENFFPRPLSFISAAIRSRRESFLKRHAVVPEPPLPAGLLNAIVSASREISRIRSESELLNDPSYLSLGRNELFDRLSKSVRSVWDTATDKPGWPHRPCVKIFKTDGSCLVTYFGVDVKLVNHQFRLIIFYAEWGKEHLGPAPDHKLVEAGVTCADLAPLMCRVRHQFRLAAQSMNEPQVRTAATQLVGTLFPPKKPRIGYFIGRPELIQVV